LLMRGGIFGGCRVSGSSIEHLGSVRMPLGWLEFVVMGEL
jgi:hypothetical protein